MKFNSFPQSGAAKGRRERVLEEAARHVRAAQTEHLGPSPPPKQPRAEAPTGLSEASPTPGQSPAPCGGEVAPLKAEA